ncbi:MAG: hypothetical protein ACLR7N_17880 [Roseburia hominis]
MHAYLKTIGFSKIKTTKELQEILRDVVENYDRKKDCGNRRTPPFC